MFDYSDTWQLVINTGTTIITFLMVFLIQNTQNRDSIAMQVKLDELIRVLDKADDSLLDVENKEEEEIIIRKEEYAQMAKNDRGPDDGPVVQETMTETTRKREVITSGNEESLDPAPAIVQQLRAAFEERKETLHAKAIELQAGGGDQATRMAHVPFRFGHFDVEAMYDLEQDLFTQLVARPLSAEGDARPTYTISLYLVGPSADADGAGDSFDAGR